MNVYDFGKPFTEGSSQKYSPMVDPKYKIDFFQVDKKHNETYFSRFLFDLPEVKPKMS